MEAFTDIKTGHQHGLSFKLFVIIAENANIRDAGHAHALML